MDSAADVSLDKGVTFESGRANMQERLQKRHATRAKDAERNREAKDRQQFAEEKGEYFSNAFKAEQKSIEELLSRCSGDDRAATVQKLEEATAKTSQLQKFVNDSVMFLTQYDLGKAQAALQQLQASLSETREEVLPKKKFTFRSRNKATAEASTTVPDAPSPGADAGSTKTDKVCADAASEQCGFSNMDGVCLIKTAEEILSREVRLTHLKNCKVRLFGSPGTLYMNHIEGCEILCGPVSRSVFVDHCRNSTLAFPCHQVRIHSTTDTQVYVHSTGQPIIEDCQRVSFAPFTWSYPTLEEDFSVSGLNPDTNNWNNVADFYWLATGTPSPNWTLIPEEDRKTSWDA